MTTDGSNMRLFINAVEDANSPEAYTGTPVNTDNKVFIGKDSRAGIGTPDAFTALPSIANAAWSLQQIENFYNATKGMFAPRG